MPYLKPLLILSLLFFINTSLAAKRSMTVDDALDMVSLGDILMSPDGRQVFFSKTRLAWEENDYRKTLYAISADGGEAVPYIGAAGGDNFQLSPDGQYLSLTRTVDGEEQIFFMPTSGGEAIQLTHHQGGVNDYKWSTDAKSIIFSADEKRSEEEQREYDLGADAVFIDEAPNGKETARFSNLWLYNLDKRTTSRITDKRFIVDSFDLSPDGRRVVLVARPDDRTNYGHFAELYLLGLKDKKLQRLTSNQAPESDPLWAPDSRHFAYRAPSDTHFDLRAGYFWIMDANSGKRKKLYGQNQGELSFDGDIAWTADGRSLLYTEVHRTTSNLYKLDVETDKVTALTDRQGSLSAAAFSADRKRMVYIYQDFTNPADIYSSALDGSDSKRLSDANPWIRQQLLLATGETLRWNSKADMEIEGVFIPALKHKRGKMLLILHIHGGPAGVIQNRFRPDFQMLAGLGYAILAPNVRGSTGYGDKILRGLMGEVGDGEFIDQMTGIDYVIEHKNIDPERLGIRGWSWGGVSTGYTITQTQRFKAASVGAMVTNWAAETGPGYNFDVSLWYIGGTPWDNAAEWARRSSITHVKNITTPTIIFHGAEDTTSSVGQSLMFFTALRDIGKAPVRYIKFPRQGHGIEEPRLRRIYEIEEIKWFKKYIDAENWKPWERNRNERNRNDRSRNRFQDPRPQRRE